MLKRRSKILIILLIVICICGCKDKNTDAYKFKNEYESLNNTLKSVNISEENPFIYKTQEEILSLIDNEKALVIFYGNANDEDSRSIVEPIIEASKKNGLTKIYYVKLDGNEYTINNEVINKTTLVGIVRKEIYQISNDESNINSIIEKVAIELSTCDINVGC